MTIVRRAIAVTALLAVLAAAGPARAKGSREACLEAFESAQRLRKDGKVRKAREDFRTCAAESCPAMVRKDCTDALAELATRIPTVRVSARDAGGKELEDFSLEIDGEAVEVAEEPIELDPGEHVFVFVFPGGQRSERRITLKTGELNVPVVGERGGV